MNNAVEPLKDKGAFPNDETPLNGHLPENNIPYYPCLSGMVYTFRYF